MMNNEEIIENMKKLIDTLSKENEQLKEDVASTQIELEIQKANYKEITDKAKDLIFKCDKLSKEYNDALKDINSARKEYVSLISELKNIKKNYKKNVDNIIKQL